MANVVSVVSCWGSSCGLKAEGSLSVGKLYLLDIGCLLSARVVEKKELEPKLPKEFFDGIVKELKLKLGGSESKLITKGKEARGRRRNGKRQESEVGKEAESQ